MAAVVLLARESGRAGAASTALGWAVAAPPGGGPGDRGRSRVPAVGPGDRRVHRLVDPDHRAAPATRQRAAAGLARGEPRRLLRRGGGDPAGRPGRLRSVRRRSRRWSTSLVVPLVPPAMAAGDAGPRRRLAPALGAPGAVGDGRRAAGLARPAVLVADRADRGRAPVRERDAPAGTLVGAIAGGRSARRYRARCERRLGDGSGDGRPAARWRRARVRRSPERDTARRATDGSVRPVGGAGPRSGRILAATVALTLAAIVVVAANRPDGQVRVTVLDVGQGDAILVEGGQRWADARRRRTGSGPPARRARRPAAAVGPPDRPPRPDPSPRGPRRGPGAAARRATGSAGRSNPG